MSIMFKQMEYQGIACTDFFNLYNKQLYKLRKDFANH